MSERELFTAALHLSDSAARAEFLEKACAGDKPLRDRVESLLREQEKLGSFLEPPSPTPADVSGAFGPGDAGTVDLPPGDSATGTFAPEAHCPKSMATGAHDPDRATGTYSDVPAGREHPPAGALGTVIACRYTLVEVIGEGGMGSVYLASQTEPVKRQVALKLIKTGMDSKAVLARFDAERQALALMDHPNIARIYDGGLTGSGQPFFVMELVKGVPLMDYCDTHRLTVDARLQLFVAVCQAVQHAHQKGIIHRDLKPGNVLVTEVDARPTPKVIDFGVAKATELKLTDMSFSDVGAIVGTPAYMSPEQADPTSMDVDTRTDVYALGVMLYELLTGSPPIEASQFKRGAILEMLRMVREVEPPRPSTRLSEATARLNVAANRSIEPGKLAKLLQGELDWVVMKALEKDRTRRYDTANAFARDVLRYLADEVVEARPPSRGYRLKKFVRRNRGQVIAASLVLLALLAGIAGTSFALFEAKRQEHAAIVARGAEADRAEGERLAKLDAEEKTRVALAETAAKETARAKEAEERGYAEAITDFVRADFLAMTSVEGQGRWGGEGLTRNATLKELLDRAAEKLLKRSDLSERTVGDLAWIIGVSYRNLGEHDRAISFLALTVKSRQKRLGADDAETLEAQNSLAVAYHLAGRSAQAIPLHEETLKLRKAKLGPDHQATLLSMANLAQSYQAAGRLTEALPLYEETLKLQKVHLGPKHPNTLTTMNNLGSGYHAARRLAEALPLWEVALKQMKAVQGPDHTDTLSCMNNLVAGYYTAGRLAEALSLFEETLKLRKVILGPDHSDTLTTMNNLAWAYRNVGKHGLAVPLFAETLNLTKAKHGPDHAETLRAMYGLASGYRSAEQLDLALPLFEESLKLMKAKLDPDHPLTLQAMNGLAAAYRDVGKLDLALPLLEETVEQMKAKLGTDDPETLNSMSGVAASYWSLKRLDKSVPLFEEVLRLQEKKLRREHPETQGTVANLGVNYTDAGRTAEAIPLLEEVYRALKKYPDLGWVGMPLLDAYLKGGKPTEAVELLKVLLPEARQTTPKDSPQLAKLLAKFGSAQLQMKVYAEAEPLLRESLTIGEKKEPDDWRTFSTRSLLGGVLLGQKKYADAEPLLLKGYEGLKAREKTIPPQANNRIPEAVDRLIVLSTALEKPDEVKKWRAERAKYPMPKEVAPSPREKK